MSAKILVIDDEESIRFTLKRFLRAEGHEVETAETCKEALDWLHGTAFDVVFADIILDDGTGIDILRNIRVNGLNCPVIMITGDPSVSTAAESLRLEAFDYIPKPINQGALLHAARTALKYKALTDEKETYRTNLEAIFRSVNDAIITVDKDTVVIAMNDAAMSFLGCSDECIGLPFSSLPDISRGRFRTLLNDAMETGKPADADRIECNVSNTPQVISARTFPLLKPKNEVSGVVMVLRDDTPMVNMERELKEHRHFHRIIGRSDPMKKVYALIEALADVQTTVLITGESGTGKELVAEALHHAGERRSRTLVKVNCSALSENLLESELFGHVKGAFTGAIRDNVGRFQKADGGTLFLDEIGDISTTIQLKLLRVIEESKFERVGSSETTHVDVRIIAATNKNLTEKVRCGEFREDLYYRLKVVEIGLPPLRDRHTDIPLLVDHFRAGFNLKFKKNIEGISSDVLTAFLGYPWPGNIRELEHTMEHSFIMCNRNIITRDFLPSHFMSIPVASHHPKDLNPDDDIQAIRETLKRTDWNKAKAARLLGIDRVTLYRKISRYNITKDSSTIEI
jgi:two-component system, NtrC family, response regulator HydG